MFQRAFIVLLIVYLLPEFVLCPASVILRGKNDGMHFELGTIYDILCFATPVLGGHKQFSMKSNFTATNQLR